LIALDTNILLHARRRELEHHEEARALLRGLAEGHEPWALPWPCVYDFLRVVTHPRVFDLPTKMAVAFEDLDSLLASPSLMLLGEGPAHEGHLRRTVNRSGVAGNLVQDAHIAALAIERGLRQ
jgi:toxin-antitoxin system PIN domain toxin